MRAKCCIGGQGRVTSWRQRYGCSVNGGKGALGAQFIKTAMFIVCFMGAIWMIRCWMDWRRVRFNPTFAARSD